MKTGQEQIDSIRVSGVTARISGTIAAMRDFKRADRLNEQIRRLVAKQLEDELTDFSGGMVTFTAVELSKDLRYAKVYYSFLGTDENKAAIEGFLQREKGRIRSQVGRNLHMRHIPEFTFKYDSSVETGMKIERLLTEIKRDDAK